MSNDKPSRNEDEYAVRRDAELLAQQRRAAEASLIAAERKSHFMKCPKDGYDLATSDFHGVQIETCPNCHGIWLDAGEIQSLTHQRDAGFLDRVFGDVMRGIRGNRAGTKDSLLG
jgi:uncharacterized protein